MRFISKYVGANINWDEKEQEFYINNVEKTVVLNIGDKNIKVNGKAVVMDAMPTVIKDVPYVPVRFITEGLGYTIEYKSISGKSCIFITIPM